jgi:hypothetical protein
MDERTKPNHPDMMINVEGQLIAVPCECERCMPPCPVCGSRYTEQDADGAWICLPCTDTTDIRADIKGV